MCDLWSFFSFLFFPKCFEQSTLWYFCSRHFCVARQSHRFIAAFATVVFWLHFKRPMERKLLCQLFTVTNCSTLARHALKFARLLSIQSVCSSRYWAMRVSCLVLTSRRSRDRTRAFQLQTTQLLEAASCLFSFKSILLRTSGKCQCIKRTACISVKLVRDVSDIYDLKSVFMGPLKAVSVSVALCSNNRRHHAIAVPTAMQNRVTKTMSVAPPLGNKWLKQKKSNSLSESSPAPPPCSWCLGYSFFVRVQLISLLLISPGLWYIYKADDDDMTDVELHVLGCRPVDILGTNCDQCLRHSSVLLYVHRNHKAH